ncbi:EcsC family protein [Nocardioides marmoraquaticus]
MTLARDLAQQLGRRLQHDLGRAAPQLAAGFVHQAYDRAVAGVGPLEPASVVGKRAFVEHDDEAQAVSSLIESHVRLAGAQGFVTNLGGLATMPVAVPANIGGLAMIQCRMVAALAHLRGHDLADPRVRNAVLTTLLGEEKVHELVREQRLPGPPMAVATAPVHDPDLDRLVANEVAGELMTRVAGKRLAYAVGRRVPVVGGVVGAGTDGYATWQVGRFADRELLLRHHA